MNDSIPSSNQIIPFVTLHRLISEGGTSVLYQGTSTHSELPKTFIVKLTLLEGVLESEASLLSRINHPCIPKSYKIPGTDSYVGNFLDNSGNRNWYIFLDYLEGKNLFELINAHTLSFDSFLHIFEQIADCIDYINTQRISHFDIKPSNILVSEKGEAFLIDFGAWQNLGDKLRSKLIIGTPFYLPPERAKLFKDDRYIVTVSEDIYSLGVTIVSSILQKPEPDIFVDVRNSKASSLIKPHILVDFPPDLRFLLSKLTSFHSEDRFSTAHEIVDAIRDQSNEIRKVMMPTSLHGRRIKNRHVLIYIRKVIDFSFILSISLVIFGIFWILLTEAQPILRAILNSNYLLLAFGLLLLILASIAKRLTLRNDFASSNTEAIYRRTQAIRGTMLGDFARTSLPAASQGQLNVPDIPKREISSIITGQKDDVHFRAFHPSEVESGKSYSLAIYAHILSHEKDVNIDAETILQDTTVSYENADNTAKIALGTPITVEIESNYGRFDSEQLTSIWNSKYIRYLFPFVVDSNLPNDDLQIMVRISVFGIEVSSINIRIPIATQTKYSNPLKVAKLASHSSKMYQKIFVSYSRRDRIVVDNYRLAQMALGNDVFVDRYSLKPGENWQASLANAIDDADIFQLFWSEQSAQSSNCRDEWMYAIEEKCKNDETSGFIRPVFWIDPMTDKMKPPAELAHINFKFIPLEELSTTNDLLLGKLESIEQRLEVLIKLVGSRKHDSASNDKDFTFTF